MCPTPTEIFPCLQKEGAGKGQAQPELCCVQWLRACLQQTWECFHLMQRQVHVQQYRGPRSSGEGVVHRAPPWVELLRPEPLATGVSGGMSAAGTWVLRRAEGLEDEYGSSIATSHQ